MPRVTVCARAVRRDEGTQDQGRSRGGAAVSHIDRMSPYRSSAGDGMIHGWRPPDRGRRAPRCCRSSTSRAPSKSSPRRAPGYAAPPTAPRSRARTAGSCRRARPSGSRLSTSGRCAHPPNAVLSAGRRSGVERRPGHVHSTVGRVTEQPVPLARLFAMACRDFIEQLHERLRERGWKDVRPAFGFVLLGARDGDTTVTAIAELTGSTKQAASKLAATAISAERCPRSVPRGDNRTSARQPPLAARFGGFRMSMKPPLITLYLPSSICRMATLRVNMRKPASSGTSGIACLRKS